MSAPPGRPPKSTLRIGGALAFVVLTTLGLAPSASCQEASVLAVVDYIAAENLYLSAGAEHGMAVGDTISVSLERGGVEVGRVLVESVTRRRSVVSWIGPGLVWERGTALYLGILPSDPSPSDRVGAESAGIADTPDAEPGTQGVPPGESRPSTARNATSGIRSSGRIGLDLDLARTITRWEGGTDVERSFATPVLRVSAVVSNIPGNLTFRINARGSYRYTDGGAFAAPGSARVYSLSLMKTFDALPLMVQVGRFGNPYESYSGYWDGVMMRVGGSSFGIGAAAGFDPRYSNEKLSTDIPKTSGWLDFSQRGDNWRFGTDLSVHHMAPKNGLSDRTWAGWSQDLRVGAVNFYHRLQMDRAPADGSWAMSRLQAGLSAAVSRGVTIRGYYSAQEPYSIWREGDDPFLPRRDRVAAGLSLAGSTGSLSLDLGGHRAFEEDWGPSASVSFGLSPSLLGGWSLLGSGSYWERNGQVAISAAPGVTRKFGPARLRGLYHFYRSKETSFELLTHGLDLSLDAPLSKGVRGAIRFFGQSGSHTRSGRLRLALWFPL